MVKNQTPLPEKKKSFALPFYLTTTMRALRFLSTGLATRFALKLFFQPLAFPIPAREKPLREESEKEFLQTPQGEKFTLFRQGQGKPKVMFLHGWSGRSSQFFKLAELLSRDFEIFAIDAPAHGELQGPRTHMLSFVEAAKVVAEKYGAFYAAVGHSLGGMALFNALDQGVSFKKMVLIGSPASVHNVVHDFCEKTAAGPKVAARILKYLEKRYALKMKDVSTTTLSQKHNPPGLVIHDQHDQDVPVLNAREINQAWPASEIIISEGLGHRRILMEAQINQRIYEFLVN